jgi:hypothetical protein
MKRVTASDFPELRKVFSGYLHEDFIEEHATAAAALKAFAEEANATERKRFHTEVTRFLEVTEPLEFEAVRALLTRLGSRWAPPSRAALVAALTRASRPAGKPST